VRGERVKGVAGLGDRGGETAPPSTLRLLTKLESGRFGGPTLNLAHLENLGLVTRGLDSPGKLHFQITKRGLERLQWLRLQSRATTTLRRVDRAIPSEYRTVGRIIKEGEIFTWLNLRLNSQSVSRPVITSIRLGTR